MAKINRQNELSIGRHEAPNPLPEQSPTLSNVFVIWFLTISCPSFHAMMTVAII